MDTRKTRQVLGKIVKGIHDVASEIDLQINERESFWARCDETGLSLVFVHGLLSDASRAWSTRNSSWITIAQNEPIFAGMDIFVANWYSTILAQGWALDDSTDALSWDVEKWLQGHPPLAQSRDIVFVGHSMGGLLVRRMLVRNPGWLAEKRIGVVTLGTPARGAYLADLVGPLAAGMDQRQVLDIQRESLALEELHEEFGALVSASGGALLGAEFVESHLLVPKSRFFQAVEAFLPWPQPVVVLGSQGGYFGPPTVLPNTNHRSISRPTSARHPSHRALCRFVAGFRDVGH